MLVREQMPVQQRDEGLRQCTHADKVPIVSEESINPATAGNAGSYGSPIVTVGTLYIQRSLNGICLHAMEMSVGLSRVRTEYSHLNF